MIKTGFYGMLCTATLMVMGCDDEKNSNPLQPNGTNSSIVSPSISSLTVGFSVTSFTLAKPNNASSYLYGVGEIQYSGTIPQKFVEIFATYKNAAGAVIHRDSTYIDNVTTISLGGTSPIYTNAFVSSGYPKGYYVFIEDASFLPGSVANVEFSFQGDSFTPDVPSSTVDVSGNPYESDGMVHQNIVVSGSDPVDIGSSLFIFRNSTGLLYNFTYPDGYKKNGTTYQQSDILDGNSEGRLSCYKKNADIETQPYTIKQTLLNWDNATALAKKKIVAAKNPEEKLVLIRNASDEYLDALRKQL
jgi:hypothetical protein